MDWNRKIKVKICGTKAYINMILGRIGGVAIKKRVQERIIELKKVLGTIENELIHAPEGS